MITKKDLPDVAFGPSEAFGSHLDWVGMSGIEVPLKLQQADASIVQIPGKVQSFVSLDTADRGIHMSRLFKITQEKLSQNILNFSLKIGLEISSLPTTVELGLYQRAAKWPSEL